MALSVCAFVVSPAPATSFISLPLCRTSRQWRCVYSARRQEGSARRLRKRSARLIVVLADQAPTSSLEQAENAPGSKSSSTTAFFDSIGQTQKSGRATGKSALPWIVLQKSKIE